MRLLLFKTTLLTCLLLILVGCPGKQQSTRTTYGSDNLTMTCVHKALEELDDITKVWIFYDQLPFYPHGMPMDGVGFEGEKFIGNVSFQRTVSPSNHALVYVIVHTKELYWGFRDKSLFMQQIEEVKERIKEVLSTHCKG